MKMVTYKNRFIAGYNEDISGIFFKSINNIRVVFKTVLSADEARNKRKKFPGKVAKKKIEEKPTTEIFSQVNVQLTVTIFLIVN